MFVCIRRQGTCHSCQRASISSCCPHCVSLFLCNFSFFYEIIHNLGSNTHSNSTEVYRFSTIHRVVWLSLTNLRPEENILAFGIFLFHGESTPTTHDHRGPLNPFLQIVSQNAAFWPPFISEPWCFTVGQGQTKGLCIYICALFDQRI